VINVFKYIGTAVIGFILFLSNVSAIPSAIEKGSVLVGSILVHEGTLKVDRSGFAVTLFLEQTAHELSSFLVADHEWLIRLNEQGIIRGAYLEVQGKSIRLGDTFERLPNAEEGYHIHESALHFVYKSEPNGLYLDALINTNRFSGFLHPHMKKPRFVLIYDLLKDERVFLHGRQWELPAMVFRYLQLYGYRDFFVVTNKIITVSMLDGIGEGIAVVSLYPILTGRQFVVALALIVISVLSIILLALSIRYSLSGQLPFWKGDGFMAKSGDENNVVHEIDREISDLFEDEAAPEKFVEPVIKKGTGQAKEEQPVKRHKSDEKAAELAEEEEQPSVDAAPVEEKEEKPGPVQTVSAVQELERDGIIIRKG
jgi:hypothetical protein